MLNSAKNFIVSIVEDEPVLREEMAFQLEQHGFVVEIFENATQFYRFLAVNRNTVAILDIGLPDEDGLSICRHLRSHDKQIGIIFVTARAQRVERLKGLEEGADAYLLKPVDMDELILTLNRLGERFANRQTAPVADPTTLLADGWRVDLTAASVVSPGGVSVSLTLSELQLLRILAEHSPEVCTAMELGRAIGLLPDEFDKHRIEVVISRLRTKINRLAGTPIPIRAERGIGYSLSGDCRQAG